MMAELSLDLLDKVDSEVPYSELILNMMSGDKIGIASPERMLRMFKFIVYSDNKLKYKIDAIRLVYIIDKLYGIDYSDFLIKENLLDE